MTRFNPFIAMVYLMLILLVIVSTLVEELLIYLIRFVKKVKRNYQDVLGNR